MAGNEQDAGGTDATDRLVGEHLQLVGYAVGQLAQRLPAHVSRGELESAGMLGLIQAARSWDAVRGIPFDRYANARIRGALLDELRSRDWASRSVRARARRMQVATQELRERLGRTPTEVEVAAAADLDPVVASQVRDDVARAALVSLEGLVPEEGGDVPLPSAEPDPETTILDREQRGYLVDAVAALPDRLRAVIVGYFFEERPLQDVAAELGVSPSRASQLQSEALALLRDGLRAHLDPENLPAEPRPNGRVARRKAAYYAAIDAVSDPRTRVASDAPPLSERIARVDAGRAA
jgi:RNA polymerase sigma factor for flagellar operon FliA